MTHATYKESAGVDFLAMPKGVRRTFRDVIRLPERSPSILDWPTTVVK